MSPTGKRSSRRKPSLLFGDYSSTDQGQMQVISAAIHAALGYTPLQSTSHTNHDVYSYVSSEIGRRFWTDIYVDRPEIRDIIYTLQTGQVAIIAGERGTGKSTALQAVTRELKGSSPAPTPIPVNFLTGLVDTNVFREDMHDAASVADVIHRELYAELKVQITDRIGIMSFLYETDDSFVEFQTTLDYEDIHLDTPEEWRLFAEEKKYRGLIKTGIAAFAHASPSHRLRALLGYIGGRTPLEPLLIIDNVDCLLDNELAARCGFVLGSIIQSSQFRVRGAIAVRPETADAIQHGLDTLPRPHLITMQRPLTPNGQHEQTDVTRRFLANRFAVLRDARVVKNIRKSLEATNALGVAKRVDRDSFGNFFDRVLKLLDLMIYDMFRDDEPDEDFRQDNSEFIRALNDWHNGSLRECGLSLATFASDILQDKQHMHELRFLFESAEINSEEDARGRRAALRRITRSLLYRHLLFWSTPPADPEHPPENVMVFGGNYEPTEPPLHFLRLRILQYLCRRQRMRATVAEIRRDLQRLGAERERIDAALQDLAVKRTQDDAGLVRIEGVSDVPGTGKIRGGAIVQLLQAGRFLATELYVTAEYLFWSAVHTEAAFEQAEVPREVTSLTIQSDAFRTNVATRFLELYLGEKFQKEHPYITGFSDQWTPAKETQLI